MKTISKNAPLSLTALVFGAVLMSGSNAFGIETEEWKKTVLFMAKMQRCFANNSTRSGYYKCIGKPLPSVENDIIDKESNINFCTNKVDSQNEVLCKRLIKLSKEYLERLEKDPIFAADEKKQ